MNSSNTDLSSILFRFKLNAQHGFIKNIDTTLTAEFDQENLMG